MSLSVEDRLDLQELGARYAHAFDSADVDAFVALFTDDAAYIVPNGTRFEGAEALAEVVRSQAPNMRHLITNFVVDATPEGARGSAYFYCVRLSEDGAVRMRNIGRYDDEYVKTPAGWRIRSRRVTGGVDPALIDAPFVFATE